MLKYVMLALALIVGSSTLEATAQQAYTGSASSKTKAGLSESEKVDKLIQCVRSMKDATFIRNGSEYSCQQAADHLQSKWEKHKDKIHSAQAFIVELASKSGMSGEPYLIKFKDGSQYQTNAILSKELKRLETQ